VVVTTTRTLLQPRPPTGEIEPVTLAVGAESDFDDTIASAGRAGHTRVDMVAKRG
jgi:transcription-repair coupling factor (superfamily II helicase)